MSGSQRNSVDNGKRKSGERKRRSIESPEAGSRKSSSSDSSENEVEFRAFRRSNGNATVRPTGTSGNGGNGATGGTFYSSSNSNSISKTAGPRARVGGPRLGGLGLGGISGPSSDTVEKKEESKIKRKTVPSQTPLPDDFPLRPAPVVNPFPIPQINEPISLRSKKSISNLGNRPFLSPELPVTEVRSSAFALDRPVPEAGLRSTSPTMNVDVEEILLPEFEGFQEEINDSEDHDNSFEKKLFSNSDGDVGFDGLTAALAEGARGGEGIENSPMDPTPPTLRPRFPPPPSLHSTTDDETGDDSMEFLSPSTSLASISSNYSSYAISTLPILEALPTTPKLLSIPIIESSPNSDSIDSEDYASPAEENPYRSSTGSEDTVSSDITTTTDSSGPTTPPSTHSTIFANEPEVAPIIRILNQDVIELQDNSLERTDSIERYGSAEIESVQVLCGETISVPILSGSRSVTRGPPPPRPKRLRTPVSIASQVEPVDLGGAGVRTRGLFTDGNNGYIEDDGGGGGSAGAIRDYERRPSYAQKRGGGIEMKRNSLSGSSGSTNGLGGRSTPPIGGLPPLPMNHQLETRIIPKINPVSVEEEKITTTRPSPEISNSPSSFMSESSYGEQDGKTDESFFYRAPPIRTSNSFEPPPSLNISDELEVLVDEVVIPESTKLESKDLIIDTKSNESIISPTSSTDSIDSPTYGGSTTSGGVSYFGLGLRLPSSLTPSSSLGSSIGSTRSTTSTVQISSPITRPSVSPIEQSFALRHPLPAPLPLPIQAETPPPTVLTPPVLKSVRKPIEEIVSTISSPPAVLPPLPPVIRESPIVVATIVEPTEVIPVPEAISTPILVLASPPPPIPVAEPAQVIESIALPLEPVLVEKIVEPVLIAPPIILEPVVLAPAPVALTVPTPIISAVNPPTLSIPKVGSTIDSNSDSKSRQRTLSSTAASVALSGTILLGYGAWKGISTAATVGGVVGNWGWKKIMEVREEVNLTVAHDENGNNGDVGRGGGGGGIPGAFGAGVVESGSEDEEFFSEAEEEEDEIGLESLIEEEEEEEVISNKIGLEQEWDEGFPTPSGFVEDFKRVMLELGPEDLELDEKLELQAQQAAYASATRQHIEADESETNSTTSSMPFPTFPSIRSSSLPQTNKRPSSIRSVGTITSKLRGDQDEERDEEEELEELADLISGGRLNGQDFTRGDYNDSPGSVRSITSSTFGPKPSRSSLFGFNSITGSDNGSIRSSNRISSEGGSTFNRRISDNGSMLSNSTAPSLERSFSTTSSGSGGTTPSLSNTTTSVLKKRNSIFGSSKPISSEIGAATTLISYSSGKSKNKISSSSSISGSSITSRDSSSQPFNPSSKKVDKRSSLRRESRYSTPTKSSASSTSLSESQGTRRSIYSVRFANATSGLGLKSVAESEAEKAGGEAFGTKWIGVGRGNRYGNLTIISEGNAAEMDKEYAVQALKIKKKWRAFGEDRNWSEVRVD